MFEYRLSVEDEELDDFDEGATINVDDDMGDYGMEEEEDELVVGVVVPVAVSGPADPAVLGVVRVQVPERVGQAVRAGEGLVEVVLERGEERVAGLVAGFEDVQVSGHDGRHRGSG